MVEKIIMWLFFCVLASFDVIGILEGAKSVVEAVKKKTGLFWVPVASLALSVGLAYLLKSATGVLDILGDVLAATIFGGVTIFAIGEILGYNVITKWVFAVMDSVIAGVRKKAGAEEDRPVSGQ